MVKNINGENKITDVDDLEVYSVNEVANFFTCLSLEIQDELLTVMRTMVAGNKAKQAG